MMTGRATRPSARVNGPRGPLTLVSGAASFGYMAPRRAFLVPVGMALAALAPQAGSTKATPASSADRYTPYGEGPTPRADGLLALSVIRYGEFGPFGHSSHSS